MSGSQNEVGPAAAMREDGHGLLDAVESVLAALFSQELDTHFFDRALIETLQRREIEEYVSAVRDSGLFMEPAVETCRRLWTADPHLLLSLLVRELDAALAARYHAALHTEDVVKRQPTVGQ